MYKITNQTAHELWLGKTKLGPNQSVFVVEPPQKAYDLFSRGILKIESVQVEKPLHVQQPTANSQPQKVDELIGLLQQLLGSRKLVLDPSVDLKQMVEDFSPTQLPTGKVADLQVAFDEAIQASPELSEVVDKLRALQKKGK